MTPIMRDILSAAEGGADLWVPAHGPSLSATNAMAEYGWIEATPKGDRVYIRLTDAGRAVLSITRAT
jgi:DNA-binding PadR family transcriptional regulator